MSFTHWLAFLVASNLLLAIPGPTVLVVVSYDENGGFWDHAAPPKGDRWGPASRVPTIIVSPFAKRGR